MLTFATIGASELLHNWVVCLQRLRLPAVVAALDSQTAELSQQLGVHYLVAADSDASLDVGIAEQQRKLGFGGASANLRGNATIFLAMGARKVDSIVSILRLTMRPVVVSDCDVAWLGDPSALLEGRLPGFEDLLHADVLASTDCVDPDADVEDNGCFHQLIDSNTGVIVVRQAPAAIAFLERWKEFNANLARFHQEWETDQSAFDDLIKGRAMGHRRQLDAPTRALVLAHKKEWCGYPADAKEGDTFGAPAELGELHTPGSRSLFDVCVPNVTKRMRFGILPLQYFANGHTFYIQQLQLQTGVWPFAVHSTYQFGDDADCAFGKRQRMREWNLWHVPDNEAIPRHGVAAVGGSGAESHGGVGDGGEIAAASGGSSDATYLVLYDEAVVEPAAAWVGQRDPHVRGRQHVAHVEATRRQLAAGIALARTLNRTLVLPHFYCYCDKYWARLTQCTVGKQALRSQPLPYRCPMDHIMNIGPWYGTKEQRLRRGRCKAPERADLPAEEGFPFRPAAWLDRFGVERGVGSTAVLSLADAARRPPLPPNPPPPPQAAQRGPLPAELDDVSFTSPRNGAALSGRGPTLSLSANASDVELRANLLRALAAAGFHSPPQMLHVSLQDAASLLGCSHDARMLAYFYRRIFGTQWCWRPKEMLEPRLLTLANGSEGLMDVCTWGLQTPVPPPMCR